MGAGVGRLVLSTSLAVYLTSDEPSREVRLPQDSSESPTEPEQTPGHMPRTEESLFTLSLSLVF